MRLTSIKTFYELHFEDTLLANSIFTAGGIFCVSTSLTVLHGFSFFWVHYFSDFSIGCNNGRWWPWHKDNGPIGWRSLSFLVKYLYNDILPHIWKQLIWACKQAVCSEFQGINFQGWGKSTKTAKFIVLKNFPPYCILCMYKCIAM